MSAISIRIVQARSALERVVALEHSRLVPLEEFHRAPAYAGDLHRADMACARHAVGRGLTFEQLPEALN